MSTTTQQKKTVELTTDVFGYISENNVHTPVKRFTWKNTNGIKVQVITYGATITSIQYPNKKGTIDDIVLGYDNIKGYLENTMYHFGTMGRCTNLIKNGKFRIGNNEYSLVTNFGKHHSNGGKKGFDKSLWDYYIIGNKVILSIFSPDGSEGYPGNLIVHAIYELTNFNEFKVEYKAITTCPTIVNISNHFYFNLAGHAAGPNEINNHMVQFNCDCRTMTEADSIPNGEIKSVQNTIYDFQTPTALGLVLFKLNGYNTNLCVNRGASQKNCYVCRVTHAPSGRIMEIYSNQPGVQFETANTFPANVEQEIKNITKISSYLRNDIESFDMLDYIYGKIVEISNMDKLNNYSSLLDLVRDLQGKTTQVYRTGSLNYESDLIKRGTNRLKNVSSMTNLQKRCIEKIIKQINLFQNPNSLGKLKDKLETTVNRCSSSDDNFKQILNCEPLSNTRGKRGTRYYKYGALCIQTQNYPDAINHPKFPKAVLKPNKIYHHTIVYKFWVTSDENGPSGLL